MHTKSSLPEPGENRLRIALSCRRTHCIRTPSNRGSKRVNSKSGSGLVFVCTLSANLIGLPHVIASLDQPEQRTQPALFNNCIVCHGAVSVAASYNSSPVLKKIFFLLPCSFST